MHCKKKTVHIVSNDPNNLQQWNQNNDTSFSDNKNIKSMKNAFWNKSGLDHLKKRQISTQISTSSARKHENIKKMKVTHFTPCDKKHYIAKSLQKNQKNEIVIWSQVFVL